MVSGSEKLFPKASTLHANAGTNTQNQKIDCRVSFTKYEVTLKLAKSVCIDILKEVPMSPFLKEQLQGVCQTVCFNVEAVAYTLSLLLRSFRASVGCR